MYLLCIIFVLYLVLRVFISFNGALFPYGLSKYSDLFLFTFTQLCRWRCGQMFPGVWGPLHLLGISSSSEVFSVWKDCRCLSEVTPPMLITGLLVLTVPLLAHIVILISDLSAFPKSSAQTSSHTYLPAHSSPTLASLDTCCPATTSRNHV